MSLYFRFRSNLLSLHQKLIYHFSTIFHFNLIKTTILSISKDRRYLINLNNNFIIYNYQFLFLDNFQFMLKFYFLSLFFDFQPTMSQEKIHLFWSTNHFFLILFLDSNRYHQVKNIYQLFYYHRRFLDVLFSKDFVLLFLLLIDYIFYILMR